MSERARPDYFLFTIVMILVGIGLVMIFSTSGIMAQEKFGDRYYFLKKQFAWLVIGLFAT